MFDLSVHGFEQHLSVICRRYLHMSKIILKDEMWANIHVITLENDKNVSFASFLPLNQSMEVHLIISTGKSLPSCIVDVFSHIVAPVNQCRLPI